MQQLFNTRNYSVRDFEEWNSRNELVLQPKFQRRDVWSDKARSYLMDTIIRGKPIPKIYMRQDVNPKTRRAVREIVDGQQRLKTVLKPFTPALQGQQSRLEQLITIRNAIAHGSSAARGKFETLVRKELQALPLNTTVGGFLIRTKPNSHPPISFMEFYLSEVKRVAQKIVPR